MYRGSRRRYALLGDFVKMSVRGIAVYPRIIRGKRYKPIRVGYVVRGLCVNTAAWLRFIDNTRSRFFENSVVLLKKRGIFKSKYVYTPLSRHIRRKQYRFLFKNIF
jgi:ribosomal protein L14